MRLSGHTCLCLNLVHKSQNDKINTYEVLPRQRRYAKITRSTVGQQQ